MTWFNVLIALLTRADARKILIVHYGRAMLAGISLAIVMAVAFSITLMVLTYERLEVESLAQTGASFTTPNGQTAAGVMVLVPCGPVTNGQPSACPNSVGIPGYVNCTNCSPSAPTGASSNPVNGTITVTNTFQSLITMNASRKGCTFQNQGTHTMYISAAVSPSLANSFQVPGGGYFYCSGPSNIVVTDALQITGTSGDAFAGAWQ